MSFYLESIFVERRVGKRIKERFKLFYGSDQLRESESIVNVIDGSKANKHFGKMVLVSFLFVCCCSDVQASNAYAMLCPCHEHI